MQTADSKCHTRKPISDLRLLFYGFGALFLARGPWAAVILVLWSTLLATIYPAEAQQPPKSPRIGFLTAGSPSTIAARIDALREGLRELGYVEGKNILIEWRFAEGNPDRLPALMTELVRLNVDVIVSAGAAVTRPAKEATRTIPIVMAQDTDPVGNGFVATLARPGGNITGLSSYSAELNGKRVELLKDVAPKLSRLAVLGQSTYPGNAEALKESELAAGALKVRVQYLDIFAPRDIESVFREASKGRADGFLVLQSAILNSHRKQATDLAIKSRLPAIYYAPEFVEGGGLMSYAASINDLYRRAAAFVDKILKGAKPADLPVEQPIKFEFIINLRAAKQIGLTIPPNVLARADRVIR
jgi:putative ABC transport system substrate-binding protein